MMVVYSELRRMGDKVVVAYLKVIPGLRVEA